MHSYAYLLCQMPRGNLETIFPRVLVLSSVRRHLDQLRYGDAFKIMRKHRINLNLIYDHDPEVITNNLVTGDSICFDF